MKKPAPFINSRTELVRNSDIICYGVGAVTSTGGTHVFLKEGSPSDKRVKKLIHRSWPVNKTEHK